MPHQLSLYASRKVLWLISRYFLSLVLAKYSPYLLASYFCFLASRFNLYALYVLLFSYFILEWYVPSEYFVGSSTNY